MNVKHLMSKLRVMLSEDSAVASVISKFAEAELVDGTKVQTEGELVIGAILNTVAEDGTLTPAPTGMHETVDGTVITIGEMGEIIEVATVAEETEDDSVEEVVMEDVTVATDVAPEDVPATEELLAGIADLIAPFTQEITSLKEQLTSLSAKFAAFKEEPAAQPIKKTFAQVAVEKKSAAESRFDSLAKFKNKNKTN